MGIGPSTKETSLHHFRDPLLDVVSKDTDVDLMGVMLVGSPDGNEDKMLVGTRAAVWAECMRADGVILSCDGSGKQPCRLYKYNGTDRHTRNTGYRDYF